VGKKNSIDSVKILGHFTISKIRETILPNLDRMTEKMLTAVKY